MKFNLGDHIISENSIKDSSVSALPQTTCSRGSSAGFLSKLIGLDSWSPGAGSGSRTNSRRLVYATLCENNFWVIKMLKKINIFDRIIRKRNMKHLVLRK